MSPPGLQSSVPPTPGTLNTFRDALDRAVQRRLGLRQHRPVARPGLVDRGECQQDAAFRIVGKAGLGCHGELASGRCPALLLGLAPLVDGEEATNQGDNESDADGRQLDSQTAVGPCLSLDAFRRLPRLAVAGVSARGEELALQLWRILALTLGEVEGDLKASPSVQGPFVTAEVDPARCRLAQVAAAR